jgi:hypothetical protein
MQDSFTRLFLLSNKETTYVYANREQDAVLNG